MSQEDALSPVPREPDSNETRRRLLEAAGEVFAEQGYRSATIRDICARAGANVAAVNYHFGDKERLYAAVFQQVRTCSHDLDTALAEELRPEQRLRAFIYSFVKRAFEKGMPAWHEQLISREMVEPTAVFEQFIEKDIRPRNRLLSELVREIAGPGIADDDVRRCVCSIIGQALFYHHGRRVMDRLYPAVVHDEAEANALADHVMQFSLAGIRSAAGVRSIGGVREAASSPMRLAPGDRSPKAPDPVEAE